MLGLILVLLAVAVVRFWLSNREQAKTQLAEELTNARGELENLRRTPEVAPLPTRQDQEPPHAPDPEEVAKRRRDTWSKVDSAVASVLKDSSDPVQQADAKLLRADLNYHWALLASLGQMPEAAKNRALAIDGKPEEYFEKAFQNYTDVVNQAASLPARQIITARLGLAAVAENRRDFAQAAQQYQAVVKDAPDELSREQAANSLQFLAMNRADALIGPPRASIGDNPLSPLPPATTTTSPTTSPTTATSPATTTAPTTTATTVPTTTAAATVPTTSPAVAAPPAATAPATTPAAASTTIPATEPTTAPASTRPTTLPATAP